jgi:hypothetical protein
MKSILRLALLVVFSTIATLAFSSCQARRGGGASTDGYTPPPTMSPVDATDRMRDQFRQWR